MHVIRSLIIAVLAALSLASGAYAQSGTSTLEAANIRVIRQHHDIMNTGDFTKAAESFATDTRNHGRPVGRAGVLATLADIYRTFPDWRMDIDTLVASGDDVVVRMTVSGTHKGIGQRPINGAMLVGVAPTGKRFSVQHIHWYTLKNGLIVEHRANRDDIGMMRQLGLLPPPPAPPAPPAR